MQVYRGLDIGTNKPSQAERRAVPHHLVDICEPHDSFSAFAFAEAAATAIHAIQRRGGFPILVGGTGLYLRAFLKGQLAGGGRDAELRERLQAEAARDGVPALYARLRTLDPLSAETIRPGDLVRIVRALEVWEGTGRPPSELRPDLWDAPQVALSGFLVLTRPREELAELIERRSARMWEAGLLDEVRGLVAAGVAPDARSLQSIGYRQAVAVLAGRLNLAEAQRDLVRATRQYAKRQLTWFRREPAAEWISASGAAWLEPLVEQLAFRLMASTQAGSGAQLDAGGER